MRCRTSNASELKCQLEPELRDGAAFDRFFKAATRRARPLDAGLQRAWGSCLAMVLHGKCSAVC